MNKIILALLFFLVTVSALAEIPAGPWNPGGGLTTYGKKPEEKKFKLTVEPDEESLRALAADPQKAGGVFKVRTKIENLTKENQIIEVRSCSYGDYFRADPAIVRTDVVSCADDVPEKVKLEPGKPYERELPLAFSEKAKPGETEWKLGFSVKGERVWSNPVKFKVEESMLKYPARTASGTKSSI